MPSSFLHSLTLFIHSFTNYVLCTYPVPGLVPGTEYTMVSSRHHAYHPGADSPMEEMDINPIATQTHVKF